MNKKLGLAVAGALVAFSSAANAGITIPAGDWTVDLSGNVNAYANITNVKATSGTAPVGGLAGTRDASTGKSQQYGINTGLLPSWLGFTGKSRQNDLDVEWTISFQPNASDNHAAGDANTPLNRQAYFSFGDASWGTIKIGKDLGVFAADAILNDMTLLGVGSGAGLSGGATTLGGIGSGYIYAAWKGQVAYTTPNWNGLQATIAITNPNQGFDAVAQERFGLEGKASYTFKEDAFSGKVWGSFASYDVNTAATAATPAGYTLSSSNGSSTTYTSVAAVPANPSHSYTAWAADIGATVNVADFGVTGYYYTGEGAGTTVFGAQGVTAGGAKRDSDGGYVQVTYKLPTQTKIGVAYGISNLDTASGETNATLVSSNERWTVGAYHPLTKSVNLVAEYNNVRSEGQNSANKTEQNTVSFGGILFF